jgi:hypothetical protein
LTILVNQVILGQGQSAIFQFCMLGRKSVNYDPDKICKQRRKNIVEFENFLGAVDAEPFKKLKMLNVRLFYYIFEALKPLETIQK